MFEFYKMSSIPNTDTFITGVDGVITSVCFVIAAIIIAVPKILTSCKKRNQLDLKIKHLSNLISLSESERNSIEHCTSPNCVVINMEDLKKGKKRYSLANVEGLVESKEWA